MVERKYEKNYYCGRIVANSKRLSLPISEDISKFWSLFFADDFCFFRAACIDEDSCGVLVSKCAKLWCDISEVSLKDFTNACFTFWESLAAGQQTQSSVKDMTRKNFDNLYKSLQKDLFPSAGLELQTKMVMFSVFIICITWIFYDMPLSLLPIFDLTTEQGQQFFASTVKDLGNTWCDFSSNWGLKKELGSPNIKQTSYRDGNIAL